MTETTVAPVSDTSSRAVVDAPLRMSAPFDCGPRHREPVTVGVPLPRGACRLPDELSLLNASHQRLPLQTRVLDAWPDGSIRWVLLDFQADCPDGQQADFRLTQAASSPSRGASDPAIAVRTAGASVTVDTGRAQFQLAAGTDALFASVAAGKQTVCAPNGVRVTLTDAQGRDCRVVFERVGVEETGPLRTRVRLDGIAKDAGGTWTLELVARLDFFADAAAVRVALRVRNPRRATHPGGFWDLGDAGSVLFKDLSLTLRQAAPHDAATPSAAILRCSPERGVPLQPIATPFELYQDSSGGEHWQSTNHLNRDRRVPHTFRGYRARAGAGTEALSADGLRATPIASLDAGAARVAVAMPHFWENFPKAVNVEGGDLTLRLFPRQFDDLHELQGGEQKTHEITLLFGPDGVTGTPLAWARDPLIAQAAPEWYAGTGAIPHLVTAAAEPSAAYLALTNAAIDGADTFVHKREVVDQYGWRHFGDVYGDHEAVRHTGPTPLVSHYNNQYDVISGFIYQFTRTGDPRWQAHASELARHVVDIDIYHTTEDKSAYNHGQFWHTFHYGDADTAAHRTYPRAAKGKTHGGGPSADQNYTTGLMLHHFMTGDPDARETVVDLAQYVIDLDDGSKTVFRWLAGGDTGRATVSDYFGYQGPGRSPANSLNALVDGYRLTGDRRFRAKAEQLIRRVIHPNDDLAARNLLHAETRWFYNMFLQSLGKYLDDKVERGELDDMYAYGRASLLAYARWMAEHEYPYLDKPEKLEFPTETWAAQDIRKSDVFAYAAKHAETDAQRQRFVERCAFFFDYSTRTLTGLKTRTLARPVIVLLSSGRLRGWLQHHPDARAPRPARIPADVGRPEVFVPQKTKAMKRAKLLAAGLALSGLAALVLLGVWLFT